MSKSIAMAICSLPVMLLVYILLNLIPGISPEFAKEIFHYSFLTAVGVWSIYATWSISQAKG